MGELSADQQLQNHSFLEAARALSVQRTSSRESVQTYLNALANVTFLVPMRKSEAGVECFVTHLGDAVPLVPVFTSAQEYLAFGPVIPSGYEATAAAAVPLCRMAVECFPPTATLAIDPARPDFLRVNPKLIRVVATFEWQAAART